MRRTPIWSAVILLVVLPLLAPADTPVAKIKGPSEVPPGSTIVLDARDSVSDLPIRWKVEPADAIGLTLDYDGRKGVVYLVPAAVPGVYRFTAITRGTPPGAAELDADAVVQFVTVKAPEPPAPPPAPIIDVKPGPPPPPAPVEPTPTDKLRVVIVFETGEKLTPGQYNALFGKNVSAYLNGHCMIADDQRAAWRMWDKDTDAAGESPGWKAAWALGKADPAPTPKVLLYAGDKLTSRPLPADEDAILDLLKLYGGR